MILGLYEEKYWEIFQNNDPNMCSWITQSNFTGWEEEDFKRYIQLLNEAGYK